MENNVSKKLKIALVAPSMRVVGGQSIQAKRLLDAFAGDENIELKFIPNNPQTIFQNVKFLRTIFASLKFWYSLLLSINDFELIQVFSSGMSGYVFATLPPLLFAKIYGKKVLLNYHSGELEKHIATWKKTALPTMRKFDEIVVPSQFLVDVFAKHNLPATAIFNFIDAEKFKFRGRKILRPIFLSNRNFEAHYNVGDVLRAFQIIQSKYSQAELLVAGFGTEEKSLKKLVEQLNIVNVTFAGKISNEEMARLYDQADIYLNSSIVDNMPLSLIEAFSAGLPVVSYASGGIPYLIENGETGLLVEPKDFADLAKKAMFLLENQEVAHHIINHAKDRGKNYSMENVKHEWEKYYRSQAD